MFIEHFGKRHEALGYRHHLLFAAAQSPAQLFLLLPEAGKNTEDPFSWSPPAWP